MVVCMMILFGKIAKSRIIGSVGIDIFESLMQVVKLSPREGYTIVSHSMKGLTVTAHLSSRTPGSL